MHHFHKSDDTQEAGTHEAGTHEAGTQEAGTHRDDSMEPTLQKAETNTVLIAKKYICPFCNFKTHKKYNLDMHKRNRHSAQEYPEDDIFQKGSESLPMNQQMNQKTDGSNLVNEAFDVFQNYMRMKMQLTDSMSEMIVECIDVSKYVMKKENK